MDVNPTGGHLDRRSVLLPALEKHAPSVPEGVTPKQYGRFSDQYRAAFDDARRRRIATAITVDTPQLEQVRKELRRAELFACRAIGRTGVIISGPATSGKTTAAFQGMVQAYNRHFIRYPNWVQLGHTPVVYVEIPSSSTAKGVMGRFLRYMEVSFVESMTLEARVQVVTEQLLRAHTSLIVVDEMQNMSRLSNGNFETAQALKNLLNAIPAVPLLVGIDLPRLLSHSDLGAQFASRSTLITLDRLRVGSADERKLWRGIVRAFEAQFALFNHPVGSMSPLSDYLWQRTRGSIGALARLLSIAALEVIGAGTDAEQITLDQLEAIRLDMETEREYDRARSTLTDPRKDGPRDD